MWMAQFLRVNCEIDSAVGSFGRRVWRALSNEERATEMLIYSFDPFVGIVVVWYLRSSRYGCFQTLDEKNDSGEIQVLGVL